MSLARDAMVDHYRVQRPIGTGGFATVYLAHDDRLDSAVALKVLAENRALNVDVRRRFVEEAQKLRKVKSNAVMAVFDVGETTSGQPYMVLEYADRGDVAERRAAVSGSVVTAADLDRVTDFLELALSSLHLVGIVHRDVKPANILLRSQPGAPSLDATPASLLFADDVLVLGDLGFAKDLELASGITVGGGTDAFQAPEQKRAVATIDHRADIYSATAVVVWLLAGSVPREGQTWATLIDELAVGAPTVAALRRGLAEAPGDRPATMAHWRQGFDSATPDAAATTPTGSDCWSPSGGRESVAMKPGAHSGALRPSRWLPLVVVTALAGVGLGYGLSTALNDDQGSGDEAITDVVDGMATTEAVVSGRTVNIRSPAVLEVGSPARFEADVNPPTEAEWVRAEGVATPIDTALSFTALSPGEFTVTVLVRPPDAEPQLVQHRVRAAD